MSDIIDDAFKDELDRYKSRLGKGPRSNEEERLQRAVINWLHANFTPDELFFYAVWNQNARDAIEGAKRKAMGVRAGVSDIMFIMKNGMTAAIELKAGKGRVSDSQQGFLEMLAKRGCRNAVCRSGEEVEATLRSWGLKPRYPFPPMNKGSAKLLRQHMVAKELYGKDK